MRLATVMLSMLVFTFACTMTPTAEVRPKSTSPPPFGKAPPNSRGSKPMDAEGGFSPSGRGALRMSLIAMRNSLKSIVPFPFTSNFLKSASRPFSGSGAPPLSLV